MVALVAVMAMEVVAWALLIVHYLGGFRGDHSCGPSIPPMSPMSRGSRRVSVFVVARLPTMRLGGI